MKIENNIINANNFGNFGMNGDKAGFVPKNDSGSWSKISPGVRDLYEVGGEMKVSDEALRRDDPLGQLVSKAFNLEAADFKAPEL